DQTRGKSRPSRLLEVDSRGLKEAGREDVLRNRRRFNDGFHAGVVNRVHLVIVDHSGKDTLEHFTTRLNRNRVVNQPTAANAGANHDVDAIRLNTFENSGKDINGCGGDAKLLFKQDDGR